MRRWFCSAEAKEIPKIGYTIEAQHKAVEMAINKFKWFVENVMFDVKKQNSETYGNVIEIILTENGKYLTPFEAINKAKLLRNELHKQGILKVRVLIEGEVLTFKGADRWAFEYWRDVPKCPKCVTILKEDVFTHQKTEQLFCSQKCADLDYFELMEKEEDEYECDCF